MLGTLVILLAAGAGTPNRAPRAATVSVGELVTQSQSVPLGIEAQVRADISIGSGDLSVTGGPTGCWRLTLSVAAFEPQVRYSGGSRIVHHPVIGYQGLGPIWDLEGYRCAWNLRHSEDVPIDMRVTVGTGTTHLDPGRPSPEGA